LSRVWHPGRLEWIGQILLDGAHNPGGARALVEYLDEFVNQPITMIFGSMDDKAVSEIAKILFTKADKLILTRAENSRAMPADKIRDIVPQDILPDENVFVTDTVDAALAKANTISGAEEVIVITGSLYLVGELRRILLRRNR
jgi:dihydrofolate synthase/folylpolyglutamate synthase